MKLNEIFAIAVDQNATDIHLVSGSAPRLRVAERLVPVASESDTESLLREAESPEATARLTAGLPYERTFVHGGAAFVGLILRTGDAGRSATFRVLSHAIPSLEAIADDALSLFRRIVESTRGLVLIVGPVGSGKWTTACAITDAINAEREARILVLEGHPNYRFTSRKGLVSQLHIGADCDSCERALGLVPQADADVVVLDDLPTFETLRLALGLVETGHLVIANLHADSVEDALGRLLDSAGPDEEALRRSLAENLLVLTAQRLLPGTGGRGRVPLYEWISDSPAIKAALRDGDVSEAQASDPGGRTAAAAFDALVKAGKVDRL